MVNDTFKEYTDIRSAFPQLRDSDTLFFDNAATTLIPDTVINSVTNHLSHHVSAVHRGSYKLAEQNTDRFENARREIAFHLGAQKHEVAFTHNASYAFVLLATALSRVRNRVLINKLDHHSTILPWVQNYQVEYLPVGKDLMIELDKFAELNLSDQSIVVISHVSNVTGVIQPIEDIAELCRQYDALLIVDGCQSYPHTKIDVKKLGSTLFIYSPHKAFGLPGVGVIYVSEDWQHRLPTISHTGGTVEKVDLETGVVTRPFPHQIEFGSPNVPGVIAAALAAEFLASTRKQLPHHLDHLRKVLVNGLREHFEILGESTHHGPLTLKIPAGNSELVSSLLSERFDINTRGGFHCAHPLHRHLGSGGGLRISPFYYNTEQECRTLIESLKQLI